jgi:hypothetical protein
MVDDFWPIDQEGQPIPPANLPLMIALHERRPAYERFFIRGFNGVERPLEAVAIPILGIQGEFLGAVTCSSASMLVTAYNSSSTTVRRVNSEDCKLIPRSHCAPLQATPGTERVVASQRDWTEPGRWLQASGVTEHSASSSRECARPDLEKLRWSFFPPHPSDPKTR